MSVEMLAKIIRFFSPPVFEGDEAKTRIARLLNIIALAGILVAGVGLFVLPESRRTFSLISIGVFLAVELTMRRGYVRVASITIITCMIVILVVSTFTGGGIYSVGFHAFAVLILFAGLLLGGRAAIGTTIFSILYGVFLYVADARGWLTDLYAPGITASWIAGSVYFVMTGAMLTLALQMIDRAMKQAKSAMEELEQVSDGYYALFDNSPIGIYRSSVDGRMIEANQALMRFNGYENKEEFLKSVTDIAAEWYVEPERRNTFQHELEQSGRVINFESEVYRHKTRERVWITENARAVRDSKGKILYYEGTVEDITPRKQTESELDFLYNLAISFARGKDLISVLRTLRSEVLKLVPADALFIATRDDNADFVDYPIFFIGAESKEYPSHSLSDSPGLTRGVIVGGQTLYLSDILADGNETRFSPADKDAPLLRTFLGIPLTIDEKVIGMLSVQSGKKDAYSPDQIRLMETMAFQAALAIDKARLLDRLKLELQEREKIENEFLRRAEEMSLLYQISRVLTSGQDLYHALRAFVKELTRVMVVDSFHVGFYDAQNDLFTYSLFLDLGEDFEIPPRSLRENPGLTWEVISGERTVYLPDITDPQAQKQHNILVVRDIGIRSYVGIPLSLQDRVVGVMSVQALQPDAYNPNQIRLLETLAAQVANTVEKGRLLDQLRKELAERTKVETSLRQRESMLEAVTFAAEQFLKTSDWRADINTVLENLGDTINASHCYVFEHHSGVDGEELSSLRYEWAAPGFTSSVNNPVYQAHQIRWEPGTTDEILRRGEAFIASASTFPPLEKQRLSSMGIKALIEAPVFVNGRWWGTLGVDDMTKDRDWSSAETDVIRATANALGAAIKRHLDETAIQVELSERRYVETSLRQRESILEVVAQAANRLLKSPDWTLEIEWMLENLGMVIRASHAYLFENHLNDDGTPVTSMRFEWTEASHPSDLGAALFQNVLLREPNFESWYEVMSAGLPFIGDQQHLAEDDLHFLLARGMKALLDVPIIVDGEWWGTIGFDDMDHARVWSNAEVDALLVAANILGTAIERRRVDQLLQEELAQRKQLNAELAAKNSELERFTYTVSHDLKSPLFTIRGFLGYLEKDLVDGDHARFRADAQRIEDATEKMQQLLNDLLELSRVGRLMNEPDEINMNKLVGEALKLVEGQIHERKVTVQVDENLPIVIADPQRIMEVAQNLVDNAVKFMGSQPHPRVEIGQAGVEDGMAVLFVRDNGMGISREHFERVFGLFNKLDPKTDGTGIGLALVKRIIEFHGGRIWVESEPGNGSTFFFTLPAKPKLDSVI